MNFDYALLARVLLTFVALGYGFAPLTMDFDKTRLANPEGAQHTDFYIVWQVASYLGIGLIALVLIWWPGPNAVARLYLAALLAGALHVGFFVALYAMLLHGGAIHKDIGPQPSVSHVQVMAPNWTVNVTLLFGLTILLIAGVLSIAAAGQQAF